jgi:tetratricopeptide (TPR) repeat protein
MRHGTSKVYIDAREFIDRLQPALKKQDWSALMATLRANWSTDQVLSLLDCAECDARKIAALSIGLIGESCCLPRLSRKLHDHDPMVVQMAEHAMWQIWFRSGPPHANQELARGAAALNLQDIDKALTHLDKAIRIAPDFAEAYNQRAIAHYLAERFDDSIADCRHTVQLMPVHFGAYAGKGHSHLAKGELSDALEAYEKALQINPHLECIRELVHELRERKDELNWQ